MYNLSIKKEYPVKTDKSISSKQEIERNSILAKFPQTNPNIVFNMDENHVDYYNPAAEKWLVEHYFSNPDELFCLLPENVHEQINSEIKSEECISGETRFNKKHYRYSISKFPELDVFFVELIDISEQKRIERLRADTERIVKHDIKSPLTAILGHAQLMSISNDEQKNKQRAQIIYSAGIEINDMIDSAMDIFKMEEGYYKLNTEEFNLLDVINEISNNVVTIYNNEISCSVSIENTMNQIPIVAEKKHIKTVLNNIIKNALEASPEEDAIQIDIFNDNKNYVIEISNKGEIPESICANFFDKYVTHGKEHGTGLGTYSSKLIVETHNGTLDVNNTDGVVTLVIRLPAPATAAATTTAG